MKEVSLTRVQRDALAEIVERYDRSRPDMRTCYVCGEDTANWIQSSDPDDLAYMCSEHLTDLDTETELP